MSRLTSSILIIATIFAVQIALLHCAPAQISTDRYDIFTEFSTEFIQAKQTYKGVAYGGRRTVYKIAASSKNRVNLKVSVFSQSFPKVEDGEPEKIVACTQLTPFAPKPYYPYNSHTGAVLTCDKTQEANANIALVAARNVDYYFSITTLPSSGYSGNADYCRGNSSCYTNYNFTVTWSECNGKWGNNCDIEPKEAAIGIQQTGTLKSQSDQLYYYFKVDAELSHSVTATISATSAKDSICFYATYEYLPIGSSQNISELADAQACGQDLVFDRPGVGNTYITVGINPDVTFTTDIAVTFQVDLNNCQSQACTNRTFDSIADNTHSAIHLGPDTPTYRKFTITTAGPLPYIVALRTMFDLNEKGTLGFGYYIQATNTEWPQYNSLVMNAFLLVNTPSRSISNQTAMIMTVPQAGTWEFVISCTAANCPQTTQTGTLDIISAPCRSSCKAPSGTCKGLGVCECIADHVGDACDPFVPFYAVGEEKKGIISPNQWLYFTINETEDVVLTLYNKQKGQYLNLFTQKNEAPQVYNYAGAIFKGPYKIYLQLNNGASKWVAGLYNGNDGVSVTNEIEYDLILDIDASSSNSGPPIAVIVIASIICGFVVLCSFLFVGSGILYMFLKSRGIEIPSFGSNSGSYGTLSSTDDA